MKALALALVFAGTAAQAQTSPETAPSVEQAPAAPKVVESKVKLTCSVDSRGKIIDHDGTERVVSRNGKTSESLRTTWTAGNVEYRFSEFTSYRDGQAYMKGRNEGKMETITSGNQVTEKHESTTYMTFIDSDLSFENGQPVRKDSSTSESTYEVNGNSRKLIKSIEDGKERPVIDHTETKIQTSPDSYILIVRTGPYTDEQNGGKYVHEYSEMVCIYENVK